jgi:ribosomal protein S18 acetylase RimI-like enzyme
MTKTDITKVHTQEQILDVANLAREIWTEHYTPIIGEEQVDYMLDHFQSVASITAQLANGYVYYIVSHGDKNEGYMAIVPDGDAGTCMLSKIYVRKSGRGQGFGYAMLEFAVRFCQERQIGILWLTVNKHNADSLAWYKRMGFKNVESIIQDIGGGFVMDDYRMEKTID